MTRMLMISSDCHAGGLPSMYQEYLPRELHDVAHRWWLGYAKEMLSRVGTVFDQEAVGQFQDEAGDGGLFLQASAKNEIPSDDDLVRLLSDDTSPLAPRKGEYDPDVRLRDLEGDGVVAEVIFPQMAPFGAGLQQYRREVSPEHNLAGVRAYNRWLADFCNTNPGRHAGVALINVDDIGVTVREIETAKKSGLFGGVLLPTSTGDHPYYHHPRYEPLWAACADLDMPLHSHSGWTPDYGDVPTAPAMFISEVDMWAHRPFGPLVWSGAFEKNPNLKFVFTETGCAWVINHLRMMDHKADNPIFKHFTKDLTLKPSEYFARQCWLGASFLAPHEGADRYRIGWERMMYGTDYPHIEGTWPHTMDAMRGTFGEYPEEEIRRMLGEAAVEVYGFDLDLLRPLADRLGPELDDIRQAA